MLLEVSFCLEALLAIIANEGTRTAVFADVDGEIGAVIVLFAALIVRAFMFFGRTRVVVGLYMSLQTGLFFEAVKTVRVGAVVK